MIYAGTHQRLIHRATRVHQLDTIKDKILTMGRTKVVTNQQVMCLLITTINLLEHRQIQIVFQ